MVKSARVTKGWPPERRKAQSARMRAAQIWLRSTGPRSAEGKARSCLNACQYPHMRVVSHFLRYQDLYRRYAFATLKFLKTDDFMRKLKLFSRMVRLERAMTSLLRAYRIAPDQPPAHILQACLVRALQERGDSCARASGKSSNSPEHALHNHGFPEWASFR